MCFSITAAGVAKDRAEQYQGKVTGYVIIACIVAAVGGSIFGYDIGISGGVTSMDAFLKKFFPSVYEKKMHSHENNYCKFNDQGLAAFTSSLYLAGLVATLFASPVTQNYGRRISIICGGFSFLVGAALNAAAVNFAMLLSGRIMLGVGIGFVIRTSRCTSIFNDSWRYSASRNTKQLNRTRIKGKGRKVLERIRGTQNVDAEFEDMIDVSELANAVKHPFRNILKKRNRPQLVMAICMPMFQILTGINSILFYAPVLFQSMGFKGNALLYSSALTGAVLALSTLVSIATVDKLGRGVLLIGGGIQMIICQVS
ncbi:hypothetical protein L1987_54235 [Smallanthus sonchifolius]|uniref:Uncharacterized protein n=1 Tax=Smallanthus sonchifolius TaxID=185202 RepID=A0ACB9E7M5_9ASTR|nr:hypothetical protein L1987_54235 [Smallanthus sonchifolius]